MMTTSNLKPCADCGGEVKSAGYFGAYVRVLCPNCRSMRALPAHDASKATIPKPKIKTAKEIKIAAHHFPFSSKEEVEGYYLVPMDKYDALVNRTRKLEEAAEYIHGNYSSSLGWDALKLSEALEESCKD